jgi:hypothetical protein
VGFFLRQRNDNLPDMVMGFEVVMSDWITTQTVKDAVDPGGKRA